MSIVLKHLQEMSSFTVLGFKDFYLHLSLPSLSFIMYADIEEGFSQMHSSEKKDFP